MRFARSLCENWGMVARGAEVSKARRPGSKWSSACPSWVEVWPQRNEFGWWEEAWDERMLQEHGDEWPAVFATWAQSIVERHQGGEVAAFSRFVHLETQRVLEGEVALVVPGA